MSDFPIDSRVALRPGMEKVYTRAVAGSEGWVRDRKSDPDGFPLVRIEWDKSRWRYNGQADGWTFADHFKLLEEPAPQVEEEIEPEEFLVQLRPEIEPKGRDWDQIGDYVEELSDAMEAASESEGFFMIVIRRKVNDDNPNEVMFFPSIYDNALSDEARCVIDAQLAECASANYQFMVANLMEMLLKRRQEGQSGDADL